MFKPGNLSRRGFMQKSLAALTAAGLPGWYAQQLLAEDKTEKKASANDKLTMGIIGIGSPQSRSLGVYGGAKNFKNLQFAAICDVDGRHLARAKDILTKDKYTVEPYADFRKLLEHKDINTVMVVDTRPLACPDRHRGHESGQGRLLRKAAHPHDRRSSGGPKVAKATGRVLQTGSQQRTEMGGMFRLAAEIIRSGRLGKIKTIECRIGGNPAERPDHRHGTSARRTQLGLLARADAEGRLPASSKDSKHTNCHYEFRWWYNTAAAR